MMKKVKRGMQFAYGILLNAGRDFAAVRASRMAAAIAFRTFFALTPLLFVAVGVFGAVVGDNAQAQTEILSAIEDFAGPQVADAMTDFLGASLDAAGVAAVIGLVLVFVTASSLFHEMHHNLDDIFGVPYEHTANISGFFRKRGVGFLWTLGLGLALTGVWSLNFVWRFVGGLFPEDAIRIHEVIAVLTPVVSVLLFPLIIGLSIQTMTSVRIRWRAVWFGSAFTTAAFLVAAYGMGVYFARQSSPSALTVASSVFVILLTAFVLAAVFLFGVNVTKVYADYLQGRGTGQGDKPLPLS